MAFLVFGRQVTYKMKNYLLILLFFYPGVTFSSTVYDLNELKNLAQSQSWLELVDHLTDIPPSKRNQEWNELVDLALVSRFEELLTKNDSSNILKFLDKTLPKYPKIKLNKHFMQLRAEFGIQYYESCLSYDSDECLKNFLGFVRVDPNPLYAFKVAKLMRVSVSDSKAIEFFKHAVSSETVCSDEDLKLSVVSALKHTADSRYAKVAQNIAFGQCFDSLKSTIAQTIKNNDNAKANACKEMISRNALKGISKKKCERYARGLESALN
ncbi:hypothetical protein MNBD_GAMMA16-185 [hydrothermal vent metagenome]|uniref:Uncharacterized protein n=1 Tax=hydrothermal vent metagenome TaxID=652676 RepID=A0A3B0YW88_9ZZZZ